MICKYLDEMKYIYFGYDAFIILSEYIDFNLTKDYKFYLSRIFIMF